MSFEPSAKSRFVLGLDAGPLGRWVRLILGSVVPLASTIRLLLTLEPSPRFYGSTVLYFAAIFAAYLAAHYALGEKVLARVNPWIGTLLLVGPPALVLILGIGPEAMRLALGLYLAVSLLFNFVMSYGGCEVMAIPSLIFRRRYVVYCPWNVVDVVDKAVADRRTDAAQNR